jgi:DNA replication licensing factor MCM7
LCTSVISNTPRYESLFADSIDEVLATLQPAEGAEVSEDVLDVLQIQREAQQRAASANPEVVLSVAHSSSSSHKLSFTQGADQGKSFPPSLTRRYEIQFTPRVKAKASAIREVKAVQIGQTVSVKAMVTRVMDVKPLVSVATYTCESCGWEIYQEVNSQQFTPIQKCPAPQCVTNSVAGKLYMQTRGSKFVKFQEARIQELPDQVPMGHIPRCMTVHLRGEATRTCSPGDVVTISGVFMPKRYTGFRAIKAGLIADTYLKANHIFRHKKSYDQHELDEETATQIDEEAESPTIYDRLARSIAPEIFGHEDVKKALLLLLVGGVTRKMSDGMKIRGDINVLLMGDPGVAKSQLLKHIASVAPRGVYTTGKGSSGVGLTAAVLRDPVTKEMTLEGGALVLADMGICCIDEFDKMEESDRTAIHEVMEQQTVSIAKAGITTTLNARTAILAAANPLYGRYNRKMTASQNMNLPNALLSRFDLIFLILDKSDYEGDKAMADHITYVHKHCKNPDIGFEPLKPKFIKGYISQARRMEPYVPEDLANYIVEAYVGLRQADLDNARNNNAQHVMTARMLLSILRSVCIRLWSAFSCLSVESACPLNISLSVEYQLVPWILSLSLEY